MVANNVTKIREKERFESTLQRASEILSSTLKIEQVYEEFASAVKLIVDFDRMNLNIINQEADTYTVKYIAGSSQPGRNPGDALPLEGTQTQEVLETGQGFRVSDIAKSPKYPSDNTLGALGFRSRIIIPLISQSCVVGSLSLHSFKSGMYGYEEQDILERLASLIAPHVDNAMQYLRAHEEIDAVDRVARILSGTLEIDDVFEAFSAEVRKLVIFDRISLNVINHKNGTFEIRKLLGAVEPGRSEGVAVPLAGSRTQHVMESARTLIQNELSTAPRFPIDRELAEAGMRSSISVPLVYQGQVIAVLGLWSRSTCVLGKREQTILERLTKLIAPAIHNDLIYEQAKQEMALVDDVAAIIGSSVDTNQFFDRFNEMSKLVDFDQLNINVLDVESASFRKLMRLGPVQSGRPPGDTHYPFENLVKHIIETRNTLIRPDIAKEARFQFDQEHLKAGLRCDIAVPLISMNRVIGVLTSRSRKANAYGSREQAILERLAHLIAPALEMYSAHNRLNQEKELVGLATAEASKEHQRLEMLVQTSLAGIIQLDPDGSVDLINQEAQRILNMTAVPENFLSWIDDNLELSHPDSRPIHPEQNPVNLAFNSGMTTRLTELLIRVRDGSSVHVLASCVPALNSHRAVIGVSVVLQDLGPLDYAENQRSEFLTLVGHELRTPIMVIKGGAASMLARSHSLNVDEALEYFKVINEQSDQLADLVNNLSDINRIDIGKLSMNAEPTDISEMLDDAVSSFRRLGNINDIQIIGGRNFPDVLADGRRIRQVLVNLLNNSAKFSPGSSPIEIQVETGSTHASIIVKDFGIGIPPEAVHKLFQKFYRIDETSSNRSGTGLGLAICKGIIEAHGGRIFAESPGIGQGATFTFTLPWAVEPSKKPITPPELLPRLVEHRMSPRVKGRILAVDDDIHILRYLRQIISGGGYEPVIASDPTNLVELLNCDMPDLIILDLKFPNTNGLVLLRQIREVDNVPVIFLTGQDNCDTVVSALEAGADDYITKPFSASELLARIDMVLHRRLNPAASDSLPPLVIEDLRVDFTLRDVTLAGQDVTLTSTEYDLLSCLARGAGNVLTHDQLLTHVWGDEYAGETDIVRSMIRNLRSKLMENARNPRFIITHKGVGYSMRMP